MHFIEVDRNLSHALRGTIPASPRPDQPARTPAFPVPGRQGAPGDARAACPPVITQGREPDDHRAAGNASLAAGLARFQTCVVAAPADAEVPSATTGPRERCVDAVPPGVPSMSRSDVAVATTRMRLRIALLAPPAERVPPALYGGTERVVSALTEELVRRGHRVTLFASGDSRTAATLVPVCARALRLDPTVADVHVYTMRELGLAFARADEFDVMHNHLDYFALPFTSLTRTPVVTTLHGRLDLPDLPAIFGDYPAAPLVSVSDSQRTPLRWANWVATVYNGIDLRAYPTVYTVPGTYFAFIGRISPEKNIEAAIRIARATGIPLKIAAKVDRADRDYYERVVRPLIDGQFIEYIGEIGEEAKNAFLGKAYALLFPIDWPEPFGLAMAEALACGTPVLGLRRGSVPEVVADGVTGFVRDSEEELAAAAWRIPELDRAACRRRVEERFSAATMADGYEAAYRALVRNRLPERPRPGATPRDMGEQCYTEAQVETHMVLNGTQAPAAGDEQVGPDGIGLGEHLGR